MSKVVQALLSGMFIAFILDFFLFLGIFENYIKMYEINLYYNILFADNQNLILYMLFSIALGYIALYVRTKIALSVIGVLSLLALFTLLPPVGNALGEMVLEQKNVQINMGKFSYRGDMLYNGRKIVTFYDYELKKVLKLDKTKIIGEY